MMRICVCAVIVCISIFCMWVGYKIQSLEGRCKRMEDQFDNIEDSLGGAQ
jgi:hypothetical protein